MAGVVFRNAQLIDATRNEAREGFDVLVEGSRIKEVSDKPIKVAGEGIRELDINGKTLMPGLIDAHVHVKASELDIAKLMTKPVSYLFAETAQIMQAMLMRGFTTVRDAAGADRGLADAVDDGLLVGPRLRVCGLALSQTGGHSDNRPVTMMSQAGQVLQQHNLMQQLGRIADGVDECRRAARDELRKGAHHVKIMAGGGVASPSDPIENTQYSSEELVAICEEAAAWQTYTMAHTYTPASIAMAVRAGVRTVEHCNLIDKETAELVAEMGAYHVPTNITYHALNKHGREFGLPQVSIDKLKAIVDAGLGALELTSNAGVKIGYGTDLLGACHRYQSNEFSLSAEVLGNFGAIKTSLQTAAEIMYLDDQVGRIETGYMADLIVVDGNPLVNIGCLENDGQNIPLVMKEGRIFKNLLNA